MSAKQAKLIKTLMDNGRHMFVSALVQTAAVLSSNIWTNREFSTATVEHYQSWVSENDPE